MVCRPHRLNRSRCECTLPTTVGFSRAAEAVQDEHRERDSYAGAGESDMPRRDAVRCIWGGQSKLTNPSSIDKTMPSARCSVLDHPAHGLLLTYTRRSS